jgi:hypothetical protein
MTDRDAEHLRMLEQIRALEPGEDASVAERWWRASEEERDSLAGLCAAAAAEFGEPENLYEFWRQGASTESYQRYVADLVARVNRHLAAGTGARRRP